MSVDVAKSCRGQLVTQHDLSAQHTVTRICEIIQVDTVTVGNKCTLRRVPVSMQASLEAITSEVVAAAIARPTG